MRHGDLELGRDRVEEGVEGTGALGDLNLVASLVAHPGRAADHVPEVHLGGFVLGQVLGVDAVLPQVVDAILELLLVVDPNGVENHRIRGLGDPVLELGEVHVRADELDEVLERAVALRDDAQQGSLLLETPVGELGHDAQAIEVHVRARRDGHHVTLDPVDLTVQLGTRHSHRPRGLQDGSGLVEDILDRRADLIRLDRHDPVHELLAQVEAHVTNLPHRHAVGEPVHLVQPADLTVVEGLQHGVGTLGLDADDLHVRSDGLDVRGDTRDETAAADGHEHVLHAGQLAHHLHAHRALARHHERVVKRRHEGPPLLLSPSLGVRLARVVVLPLQRDGGPEPPDRLHLDARGGDRHTDHGVAPELLGGEGDALRVVARG